MHQFRQGSLVAASVIPSWAWIATLAAHLPEILNIIAAVAGTAWSVVMLWESDTWRSWRGYKQPPIPVMMEQEEDDHGRPNLPR